MNKKITLFFTICLSMVAMLKAQHISVTNVSQVYTQDFNSLANTGASNPVSTLPNAWYSTASTYRADSGASNSGALYSYGSTLDTDRALGSLGSGSATPSYGMKFINNTGGHITAITVSYTAENWRLGQKPAKRLDSTLFSYNVGAGILEASSGWVNVNELNIKTPDTSAAAAGALNGNLALNQVAINHTISDLVIAPNDTFWIRWTEVNVSGTDDGLAVDDLTVSFTGGSVPACTAPSTPVSVVTANGVNTTTVSGSFTGVTADAYLVVIDSNATAPALINGTTYNVGDAIGTATVIGNGTSTSFFKNGLVSNTIYKVHVFPYNNSGCTGGPMYLTTTPGNDTAITLLDGCPEPTQTPTNLVFETVGDHAITGKFNHSIPPADGYVVVYSTSSNIAYPLDSVSYNVGDSIKYSSFKSKVADISTSSTDTSFSIAGLESGTKYYVAVIGYNMCGAFPNYKRTTTNGVSKDDTTTTGTPPLTDCIQPTGVSTTSMVLDSTASTITIKFTMPANADSVMVLAAPISVGFLTIRDSVFYAVGSTIASSSATPATVYYRGVDDSVTITGLTANTVYKLFVATINNKNCLNGPNYSGLATKTVKTGVVSGIKNKQSETEYALYPNPASNGFLNVKFKKAIQEEATVEIIDIIGRKLTTQTIKPGTDLQTLDVNDIAKGTYLMNIVYKGVNHVSTFIIQ